MFPLKLRTKILSALALLALALGVLSYILFSEDKDPGRDLAPLGVKEADGYLLAKDLLHRTLVIVPKGSPLPREIEERFPPSRIIRTPPQRVVIASWTFDSGIISALGLEDAIVGTAEAPERAVHPEILRLWERGAISFVGLHNALDFERIKLLDPDLVLTTTFNSMEDLEYMDFPVAGTYDTRKNDVKNRLDLTLFIGTLFGEREKALERVSVMEDTIKGIRDRASNLKKPKVSWGIYDSGHVFGLRGDFWLTELIKNAGGDYVMEDYVSDSTEISLEYFITHSKDADIFFANPYEETGIDSKADMKAFHSDLELFKAFTPDGLVVTTKELTWQDTGNLHEIALDIASIMHPELYPERSLTYFGLLPD